MLSFKIYQPKSVQRILFLCSLVPMAVPSCHSQIVLCFLSFPPGDICQRFILLGFPKNKALFVAPLLYHLFYIQFLLWLYISFKIPLLLYPKYAIFYLLKICFVSLIQVTVTVFSDLQYLGLSLPLILYVCTNYTFFQTYGFLKIALSCTVFLKIPYSSLSGNF